MINEIIDGITNAIYEKFGDAYEIHTEVSMQDMEEPAFFVRCIDPSMHKQLGSRRKAGPLFIVQYFPESEESKREINTVYEQLCDCLELIEVDAKKIRGDVECKDISDDVLTVTAQYTVFLNRREEDNHMESYDMKGAITNGN